MFEVVFLGTSASAPSIHRGLSSLAVLAGEHRFLVDCGEGTQRQILRSGIGYKRLNRVLLTHSHLDHILGLGGLVSTFVRWETIGSLEIYGGRPALDRVDALLFQVVLRDETPAIPIKLLELHPGLVMTTKAFEINAFPVTHRGQGNYGFSFHEKSHYPFLVEKAVALGVPAGPERGQLVRGEAITLADGRVITPEMVLGDEQPGAKLVIVGDTVRTDNLREFVAEADALVIESTFLETHAAEARAFGHLTAKQAATLAKDMGVKSLLLNHISRRYREREVVEEARAVFPNTIVTRDFDHFEIRRGLGAQRKALELPETDEGVADSPLEGENG
ncbi:MAG: ribonuclease Z [Armatimonadetes bacterium]|nr:ribonuclease Z [Anaerolineae bacterium]